MLTEIEHNKRIGKAIFHFRSNYNNPNKKSPVVMTQTKLAEQVNVTFQQIQKYEKGTNGVSSYRLLLIAKALKIMVSDIFIYAYQDQADMSCLFEQPMETVSEINIKDKQPLILKEEWLINEKEKQN
jgi:transcriptional regulator with XRE-family HTH domain